MNSNICHRCRIKPSNFICNECQSSLCSQCDSFVHSSLKRSHKRQKINILNSASSDLNTNYETNLNFYPNSIINNENLDENNNNNSITNDMNDNFNYIKNNNEINSRNQINNISKLASDRLLYSYNSFFN